MASSSLYGSARPSAGPGVAPAQVRGNAVPLTIPRNPSSASGKAERSSFSEGCREAQDGEPRSSLSSRFQSPKSRVGSDISSSCGAEGTSPGGTLLRRPKDRKRGFSVDVQPVSQIRLEGFEPSRNDGSSSGGRAAATSQPSSEPSAASSPAKPQGLLSRTFSAGAGGTSIKEQLEHCLESKPSIEQGIDGEAVSYLRGLQARHDVFKAPLVAAAFNIANFSYNSNHQGKVVMDQCVETACILAELGADGAAVAAALLKDVLLKSMMTEAQLRGLVPNNIVDLVVRVGRLNDICRVRQEMVEASQGAPLHPEASQRISHLLLTLADVRGVLVKLADRLAALRALPPSAPALQRDAREALDVFAPIANRLGVWSIKAALEDLAFKALHPAEHAELHLKLKESQDRGTIEGALDTLSGALHRRGLDGADLSGRPKNLYGVCRKMRDKQRGLSQVYDVRALRVIVRSKADCYAVLQEVQRLWPEVKGRFKDYIRTPKSNGYQSLHTVVELPDGCPMEIQIRTDKMHFIAEYGVAAHWRYKEREADARPDSETQQVNWARWLISWTLELNDAKCRPTGSPPGDSALATLANQICSFPSHNVGCKFAEFASRVAPRPISAEELADSPVLVVCLDHTRRSGSTGPCPASIEELPARCTRGQLPAILGIPDSAHVLVNMEVVNSPTFALAHGDRVEVFEAPADPAPQRLTPSELSGHRHRLSRLFGRPQPGGQALRPQAV